MKEESQLYHISLGFPEGVRLPAGKTLLDWGQHVEEQRRRHRGHEIKIPEVLDYEKAKIVEIEVKKGRVVKTLLRLPYDATKDLVMAVTNRGFIKTCWLNEKSDNHKTLDMSKYVAP